MTQDQQAPQEKVKPAPPAAPAPPVTRAKPVPAEPPGRPAQPVPQAKEQPAQPVPQARVRRARPAQPVPQAKEQPAQPVPQAKEQPAQPAKPAPPVPQAKAKLDSPEALVRQARQVRLAVAARLEREGKQDLQAIQGLLDQLGRVGSRDEQVPPEMKALQDLQAKLGQLVVRARQDHLALVATLDPPGKQD